MNKYEESILDLTFITANLKFVKIGGKDKIKKALTNMNELVERATPKKVGYSELHQFNICPNCDGNVYHHQHTNNCGDCGQALDWSE